MLPFFLVAHSVSGCHDAITGGRASGYREICACRSDVKRRSTCVRRDSASWNEWPEGEIDHINHIAHDNRFSNLRDVPHSLNAHNRKGPASHNRIGVLGVRPARVGKRFVSQVGVNGKPFHLGTFDTFDEAVKAREKAELKYYGFIKK